MTDPKVVHPATQNRIDSFNHDFYGPADMLPEDFPELRIQRCPLFQLARIVWPPLLIDAEDAPIFNTQNSQALSLLQLHHPAVGRVDLNTGVRELLAQAFVDHLYEP